MTKGHVSMLKRKAGFQFCVVMPSFNAVLVSYKISGKNLRLVLKEREMPDFRSFVKVSLQGSKFSVSVSDKRK